jgi:hypothetical protein
MRFLPHVSTFALLACASPAFAQVQPCPLTKIGSPCGAELDVASLQGSQPGTLDLSLRVHSAPVNSAALLFVGGARLNLPLPARNCPLLTRPDLILALVTDAQGEARIALPGPLDPGLRLFVQSAVIAAPAPALDFATSSAADLTLQPTGVHVTWAVPNFRDPLRSTTQSGKSWRPTELGGSGLLGDFDLELLRKTARTDAKGRILYEWDIDDFTVPATQTLNGKSVRVTNGIFEFTSFVVPSTARVVLVGTQPVEIHVCGTVAIHGALDASAPARNRLFHDPRYGQVGGLGGPGGGRGGHGGAQPGFQLPVDGADGEDLRLPNGHPKAGAPGSGGKGSRAHPAGTAAAQVIWISIQGTPVFCRQTAAGGGGGSWSAAGTQGTVGKVGSSSYPYVAAEFGPDALAGMPLSLAPISNVVASRVQFLVGGAGGGGGGTDPFNSFYPTVQWSAGGGGGGGGGALRLSSGSSLDLIAGADLLCRGGDTAEFQSFSGRAAAPGGGGSGGALLLQSLLAPRLQGDIDLSGGLGGSCKEDSYLGMGSFGGDGGPGFLRVESRSKPDPKSFAKLLPAPGPDNVGQLLALDHTSQSLVSSIWWRMTGTPGRLQYLRYVIHGYANGQPLTYSNDPKLAAQAAVPGQWVVAHFQSAVDSGGQPGARSRWYVGDLEELNQDPNVGLHLRWALRFDGSSGPLPRDLRIDSIDFWTTCR